MRTTTYLSIALGLALFVALIAYYGVGELAVAVAAAGWGLLWVAAYRAVTLGANTMAWRILFPAGSRPGFAGLLRLRWIGESVNSLLPVGQVGGDFVRARLAARGTSGADAGASTVVDFTLGLVTQVVFALIGVALLLRAGVDGEHGRTLLIGILVATLAVAAFYAAQRLGLFRGMAGVVGKLLPGRAWQSLAGDAAALDLCVLELYRNRRQVFLAACWRMIGWLLHTGETWLALYFLGVPSSLDNALVLESLGAAVRSAAFVVPGALGVQEGGFVVLGRALGLTPEAALALALVKRVRELLVGGPGLAAWTALEGEGLVRLMSRKS